MTNYDELMQLVRSRRSARSFTDEPLDRGDVERVIEAARWAPSSRNLQAWKFVAYDDRDFLWKLAAEVGVALRHKMSGLPRLKPEQMGEAVTRGTLFAKAPCLVVVMHQQPKFIPGDPLSAVTDPNVVADEVISAAMSVQNLLLAARSLKLGACIMTEPLAVREVFESLPEKPQGYGVTCLVALGHTTESAPTPERKGLERIFQFGAKK